MNQRIEQYQDFLARLGARCLLWLEHVGSSGIFLCSFLFQRLDFKKFLPQLIKQLFSVGVLSLPIILMSAFFIGMVLGLQGYVTLVKFGAEQALGQLIALSLVRELGPVVSALLYAGRAGSALTAEIALMKTTEQLASLEMLGVDPLSRVIAPRWWAGQISMPLLGLIFNMVAIGGGYWIAVSWLHVDGGAFWSNMQSSVNFSADVVNGIIKSVVFGFVVTWIAVYQGFAAQPTAEGIGYATTRTVVYASMVILGLDFILTAIMFGGLG